MSRVALKQRSLSEINIDANNGFHPGVSDSQSPTSSTPRNSTLASPTGFSASSHTSYSLKGQRISASESVRDLIQSFQAAHQNHDRSLTRRQLKGAQRSRSASPEKRLETIHALPIGLPPKSKRLVSTESRESRVSSSGHTAPPPYSPQETTPTIKFVSRSPPLPLTNKYKIPTTPLTPLTPLTPFRVGSPDESSNLLSRATTPLSPLFNRQATANQIKPSVAPALSSTASESSGQDSNERSSQDFAYPPIPEIPLPRSSIRIVPKTPPHVTPTRKRSTSHPRPLPSSRRPSASSSNTNGSRPRSQSSSQFPISPTQADSRRPSGSSYSSSVKAIGLPPARPLPPTPSLKIPVYPSTSTADLLETPLSPTHTPQHRSTIRLVAKSPATVEDSKGIPRSILKKGTRPSGTQASPAISDAQEPTPPLDASEFADIKPALEYIIENENSFEQHSNSVPKRARMQFNPAEAPVHPNEDYDNVVPSPMVGPSKWFAQSSSSSGGETPLSPVGIPQRLGNNRTFPNRRNKEQSVYSSSADIFARKRSSGRSSSFSVFLTRHERGSSKSLSTDSGSLRPTRRGINRRSSSLSVLSNMGIPEWAKLYYGRGRALPNIGEGEHDGRISRYSHHMRPDSSNSQASLVWVGHANPQGQDIVDQFSQPHLDNMPVNRMERLNKHVIMFAIGFICPIAWMVGAALPLPKQPRLARRNDLKEKQAAGVSSAEYNRRSADVESLPSITTFQETRRWDNARWWRNVNRCMSVVALLLIGALITLAIVGSLHK